MPSSVLIGFVGGALAMGYLVAAGFFLRFWATSRDRLFLAFAGTFALMAAAQVFTLMGRSAQEGNGQVYLPRLAAFVLIIVAILLKNLPSRRT
ncbi:hypothetical protein ASD21_00480 [Caulobacter sp. Root1455]|uniref:DUF5985 family protein n=1 Tax=Caulobacter sp. Root1455 TaxID=1736465 RepID=UPI0007005C4C|nr:DUF5985 family protein [Caulobacter sp. Root1455]KQZ06154.1 hypothetical protein ASD21_00480 [Caulobacter sp. Root1455]